MQVTFGGLIADRRKAQGHTQASFAQRIGISRNYLSQIERNQTPSLSVKVLGVLAEGTGIATPALLDAYRIQYHISV